MEKYVLIREMDNADCPNVGVIAVNDNFQKNLREAIESHFDATIIDIKEVDPQDVINGKPMDLFVKVDVGFDEMTYGVEVGEVFLYS